MSHFQMNMNQVKRQSSFTELSDVETKKQRTNPCVPSINSITSIENLSNEVFYEIFDYLDGYSIYKAFSNLNIRFQQLITSSLLLLKMEFSELLEPEMEDICKYVINSNTHRIISLSFEELSINEFLTQCVIDSSFTALQSVTFDEIPSHKLTALLFYLNSLPRLTSLTVILDDDDITDLSDIYRMIFQLHFLKYNRLSLAEENEITAFVPFAVNERFSTIEYLIMCHDCTLNELASILYHTPRLRHLRCEDLYQSHNNMDNEISLTLSNLTHIRMNECFLKFDTFEKFMKKICSQLKVLNILTIDNDDYVDPNRWEQLIIQHMPHLLEFTVQCFIIDVDEDEFQDMHLNMFLTQFNSQFWIDRGWVFALGFCDGVIFYSIKLKRELWCYLDEKTDIVTCSNQNSCHDLSPHIICSTLQEVNKSSTDYSHIIELSVLDWDCVESNISIIDKLKPMLLAVQINSLYIFFDQTPLCTFLKLINLLPNLDSLIVRGLSSLELSNLSIEDAESLRLVTKNNKITKIWLPTDLKHLEFLITLCPRTKYIEVDYILVKELKKVVRFILMKTTTHVPHLNSLRLKIREANDGMIVKLQKMIASEKLISDYLIKRCGSDITLKWKLQ